MRKIRIGKQDRFGIDIEAHWYWFEVGITIYKGYFGWLIRFSLAFFSIGLFIYENPELLEEGK